MTHYNEELTKLYGEPIGGSRPEICSRNPRGEGTIFPDYVPNSGQMQYNYKCMFDRSAWNAEQRTLVTIHPGEYSDDPAYNSEGAVVIGYEQEWEG